MKPEIKILDYDHELAEQVAVRVFAGWDRQMPRPPHTRENFLFLEFDGFKLALFVSGGNIRGGEVFSLRTGERLPRSPWGGLPREIVDFVRIEHFKKSDPAGYQKMLDRRYPEYGAVKWSL